MQHWIRISAPLWMIAIVVFPTSAIRAEITADQVRRAISRGTGYLIRTQREDGSWQGMESLGFPGGVTSLAVVALIYSGIPDGHPAIDKALQYLRQVDPQKTYTVALQTMAFVAARQEENRLRIEQNVNWLERAQIKSGPAQGMWSYNLHHAQGGDHSNTQFALLALRDASEIGVSVAPKIWERTQQMWRSTQKPDGGWGYRIFPQSTGSMTSAGIASLVITGSQLSKGLETITRTGEIHRCGQYDADTSLENAVRWMGKNFSVHNNPNNDKSGWWLYYMYALERAGRLSARRFFGEHDWYREGAEILVNEGFHDALTGAWRGRGGSSDVERRYPALATSYALLFLSKGKSPVVINKLAYGNGTDWNNDRHDVHNLTRFLSSHWKRPPHEHLTWQIVQSNTATTTDLLQAPILFFNGHESPSFSEQEIDVLKSYIEEGGTLLAEACCGRAEFDQGFRNLISSMYPEQDNPLKLLSRDHPLWSAEFLLEPSSSLPIWGFDFGCRTAILYSPQDLSCFWEQGSAQQHLKSPHLDPMIEKAMTIGTNIVAYATGQEFSDKLTQRDTFVNEQIPQPLGKRGVLQIAQLRHTGGFNAAPKALNNLLIALNRLIPGMKVDPDPIEVTLGNPALLSYPVLYMHGKSAFRFTTEEARQMRIYLDLGGVLFADATCGSESFDRSFRTFCKQLYPEIELERIDPKHPLFQSTDSGGVWFNISQTTRREPQRSGPNAPLRSVTRTTTPHLEGIQHEDRYGILYSPYDISCALEHSRSVQCKGYIHQDALKIAVNAMIYAVHFQ